MSVCHCGLVSCSGHRGVWMSCNHICWWYHKLILRVGGLRSPSKYTFLLNPCFALTVTLKCMENPDKASFEVTYKTYPAVNLMLLLFLHLLTQLKNVRCHFLPGKGHLTKGHRTWYTNFCFHKALQWPFWIMHHIRNTKWLKLLLKFQQTCLKDIMSANLKYKKCILTALWFFSFPCQWSSSSWPLHTSPLTLAFTSQVSA